MNTPRFASHLVAAALLAAPWIAQAEAFHGGTGLASSAVGYAKSLSSTTSLRADLASWPGVGRESIDEGTSHAERVKSDRDSSLIHGHVASSMRLSGGMTYNRTRVDLRGGTHSGIPQFGQVPYVSAQNDRFDSARRVTALPYLNAGSGQPSASGSSFLFDIGGRFARASLGDRPSGPGLGAASQSALDNELAQLRDGIGRTRFSPQVLLGMKLRF